MCPPSHLQSRCRDDSKHGNVVAYESDQRRPHRDAAHKIACAINWINHPLKLGVTWPDNAVLFAVDAVLGSLGTQNVCDRSFSGTIDFGYFAFVGLAHHRKTARVKPCETHRVCRVGDTQCKLQLVIERNIAHNGNTKIIWA